MDALSRRGHTILYKTKYYTNAILSYTITWYDIL